MSGSRTTWRARYADTGEAAQNVIGTRYTPAATYREAQAEADRSGRTVIVAPQGQRSGRHFDPVPR